MISIPLIFNNPITFVLKLYHSAIYFGFDCVRDPMFYASSVVRSTHSQVYPISVIGIEETLFRIVFYRNSLSLL